jgi:hypothetical protein
MAVAAALVRASAPGERIVAPQVAPQPGRVALIA